MNPPSDSPCDRPGPWAWSGTLPAELDLDRPSIARIIDYVLGDGSSFSADRVAAELIISSAPSYPRWVRDNAEFVRGAIHRMRACGIRQFLDLGAGLGSTRGSVLHLTRTTNGSNSSNGRNGDGVRVACVDRDPLTAAHLRVCAQARAASDGGAGTVSVHQLDLYTTDEVLHADEVWRHLDPGLPMGIVLTGVLHHEPDAHRIAGALRRYHDAVAEGSMLAVTHISPEQARPDELAAVVQSHTRLGFSLTPRSRVDLRSLLGPWVPSEWTCRSHGLGLAVHAVKPHHR